MKMDFYIELQSRILTESENISKSHHKNQDPSKIFNEILLNRLVSGGKTSIFNSNLIFRPEKKGLKDS